MALSDYWYSFMDGNAISTVLNNKYGTTGINAGDTVHIDIYCIDMDKVGGIFFDWGGNSSVVENFVRNYRSVAEKSATRFSPRAQRARSAWGFRCFASRRSRPAAALR